MPTSPQDRKPSAKGLFRFTGGDGKSYVLPNADKGRKALKGRDLRDATMGGDVGMTAYLFKMLEATNPPGAALDALYEMPQSEMMDVLQAWGQHGDGDGASLGE